VASAEIGLQRITVQKLRAAAVELDVALGVHGSLGVYSPSGFAEEVDTFSLPPAVRIDFVEAGRRWLPDLVHEFHEHWEKRIRDSDPDTRISMAEFTKELLCERGGKDGKLNLIGKAKGIHDVRVRAEREQQAAEPRLLHLRAPPARSRPDRLPPSRPDLREPPVG